MSAYTVRVTSWENDADHYETNEIRELTKADAEFYRDLASLFLFVREERCRNGNEYHEPEAIIQAIAPVIEKHLPTMSDHQAERWKQFNVDVEADDFSLTNMDEDQLIEQMYEILGSPVDYDYGFYRMVSCIEVEEIKAGSVGWVRENPERAAEYIKTLQEKLAQK